MVAEERYARLSLQMAVANHRELMARLLGQRKLHVTDLRPKEALMRSSERTMFSGLVGLHHKIK
jgi:hypothetical protein